MSVNQLRQHKPSPHFVRCSGLRALALTIALLPAVGLSDTPSAPEALNFRVEADQVVLEWSPAADDNAVRGYNIYRGAQYLTTVFGTEYTLPVRTAEGYDFHIVAYDRPKSGASRSYSIPSNSVTIPAELSAGISTQPVNAAPTAPTVLSAQRTQTTQIELLWTGASDDERVTGYKLYRDDQHVQTVFGTTAVDLVPAAGLRHHYYVVAFDKRQKLSAKSPTLSIGAVVGSTAIVGMPNGPQRLAPQAPIPASDSTTDDKVNGKQLKQHPWVRTWWLSTIAKR